MLSGEPPPAKPRSMISRKPEGIARVAVAVTTRVPGAKVNPGYGPGRELVDAGAVMVPRLRAPQARVLLIAALASGSPVDDVVARWG